MRTPFTLTMEGVVESASPCMGARLGAGATLCEAPKWPSAWGGPGDAAAAALRPLLPPSDPALRAWVPVRGGGFSTMANTVEGSARACGASVVLGIACGGGGCAHSEGRARAQRHVHRWGN